MHLGVVMVNGYPIGPDAGVERCLFSVQADPEADILATLDALAVTLQLS